jgi:hypothetical protein
MDTPTRNAHVPTEQDAEVRRRNQQRIDPSGHNMQVPPGQQQDIAESDDHGWGTPAPAEIDQKTVDELKD